MIYYLLTIPMRIIATITLLIINIIFSPFMVLYCIIDAKDFKFSEDVEYFRSIWK